MLVPNRPSGRRTNKSLCLLPGTSVPRNPDPISKAFVAGIDSIAWASIASNLSKTGSPSPGGTLRITQVIVPPIESCASFARMIRCARKASNKISYQLIETRNRVRAGELGEGGGGKSEERLLLSSSRRSRDGDSA